MYRALNVVEILWVVLISVQRVQGKVLHLLLPILTSYAVETCIFVHYKLQ